MHSLRAGRLRILGAQVHHPHPQRAQRHTPPAGDQRGQAGQLAHLDLDPGRLRGGGSVIRWVTATAPSNIGLG